MKIYKYKLLDSKLCEVNGGLLHMYPGRILKVDVQRGSICIWALADTKKPLEPRQFHLIATGELVPPGLNYIGIALLREGSFVLHVFEQLLQTVESADGGARFGLTPKIRGDKNDGV